MRGLPEFGGELPVAVLAEEIETPGAGQIRALLTSAGNPVLSTPNGARLERSHYALGAANYMVRNVAKYSAAVFLRAADQRHDWEICVELGTRLLGPSGAFGRVARTLGRRLPPESLLATWLRTGPYGLRRGLRGLSLSRLKEQPHGVDLSVRSNPGCPAGFRCARGRSTSHRASTWTTCRGCGAG